MLSMEALLEEAKTQELPLLKKRGILREYLQIIALNSIYKNPLGKRLFFTGGTALRFFYGLPRFSEDLDFDTPRLEEKELGEILEGVKKGFLREGFSPDVSFKRRKRLTLVELRFQDLMRTYEITDRRGLDLMIKIDIYEPSWEIKSESAVFSLYGYHITALLLEKGCLFSEKLMALLDRRRGRDVFDTLFLLKKRFPFDKGVLLANQMKESPERLIREHLKSLPEKELKFLADQVKPFLFKEEDVELVAKAPLFAERISP